MPFDPFDRMPAGSTMRPMEQVTIPRTYVRVELSCFYCGHSYGDVRVPVPDRPTYRDIKGALEATPGAPEIEWDAHSAPRCPRCRGKLFIEESERRVSARADQTPSQR